MYILNKELVKIHPLYLYFVLKFYPFLLLPLEETIKLKLIPSMSTDKGKDPAYQTRYQERVAASQEQTQVPPPEQSSSTQGFDIQLSTGTTLRNPTPPPPRPPSPPLVTAAPPLPNPRMANSSIKINKEGLKFSGRKADYKKWRGVIGLHLIANADTYNNDKKKVAFVLSYMTGSHSVSLWSTNRQETFEEAGWPTWTEFQADMDHDFIDPATKAQALHRLQEFRQGNMPARTFFESLELLFKLAGYTPAPRHHSHTSHDGDAQSQSSYDDDDDEDEKYEVAKRAMDPELRANLTMIGFPSSYILLRDKMIKIDDARRQMDFYSPFHIDSRFKERDQGATYTDKVIAFSKKDRGPHRQQYRVQGHSQQRVSYQDIMKMPPGQRPRPNSPCFKCQKANRTTFHW